MSTLLPTYETCPDHGVLVKNQHLDTEDTIFRLDDTDRVIVCK